MARTDPDRTHLREVIASLVAVAGLVAVVGVVALGVLSLPDEDKGPNVVTIVSAAIGVITPIVGAYFGVRSAARAVEHVKKASHG